MDILVHVSAPATVYHDKQHLALAQAIFDFQPVKFTRAGPRKCAGNVLNSRSQCSLGNRWGEGSEAEAASKSHLKRSRTASSINPNPPYRNPLRRDRNSDTSGGLITSSRPRTAPEPDTSDVQIPRTHSAIRRAFSDPLPSTLSKISDSQAHMSPNGSSYGHVSSPLGLKGDVVVGLSQSSIDDQPPSKRARLQDQLSLSPTAIESSTQAKNSAQAKEAISVWSSPPSCAAAPQGPHSDVSTATPSETSYAGFMLTEKHSDPTKSTASIISVSSGLTDHRCPEELSLCEEAMPVGGGKEPIVSQSTSSLPFTAIDGLEREVNAPQPLVGKGKFTSHITEHLQELFVRPGLCKFFQPLRVARDVKVLERGYWLMEIIIAEDQVVHQARNSPTKEATGQSYSNRFAGKTAKERLARFWQAKEVGKMTEYDYGHEDEAVGKWTEDEFVAFWAQMSRYIARGRAGWGVRMVRDDIEISNAASPTRTVRVRIFTWGEVIPHIYLAIWVCSNKTAIRIPMKWIAGDGSVVIEMSGKKKFAGGLPAWIRKGPAGEGGSVGIADVDKCK